VRLLQVAAAAGSRNLGIAAYCGISSMFCSNVRNANYATVLPSSSKRSRGDARLLWFEIVKEKPSLKGRTYRVRHWIEINRAAALTLLATVVAVRLGFD
jgi:hypothetical protein